MYLLIVESTYNLVHKCCGTKHPLKGTRVYCFYYNRNFHGLFFDFGCSRPTSVPLKIMKSFLQNKKYYYALTNETHSQTIISLYHWHSNIFQITIFVALHHSSAPGSAGWLWACLFPFTNVLPLWLTVEEHFIEPWALQIHVVVFPSNFLTYVNP